jgi:hypothetical protein
MNRVSLLIATTCTLLVGAQAFAADPANPSKISRRQMVDCMMKRMSADKVLSYNNAAKDCISQLKMQNDKLASNASVKPTDGR